MQISKSKTFEDLWRPRKTKNEDSSGLKRYTRGKNFVLEQNVFHITLKSFDDNKVLQNCQLDMLIFVQVYKTLDKNDEIIKRFWKNKREQRNKQKGSF